MDALSITLCFGVMLGILQLTTGQMLKCIQCTHIQWDPNLQFTGSDTVKRMLGTKFNLHCTLDNPYDRYQYNRLQQYQMQMGFGNVQASTVIGETICPSFTEYNRCQYIRGLVLVRLNNHNQDMTLNMTVRDCTQPTEFMDNYCYERITHYQELTNFFQDQLSFLGSVTVLKFVGHQCYCNTDMCTPIVSGSLPLAVPRVGTTATQTLEVTVTDVNEGPICVINYNIAVTDGDTNDPEIVTVSCTDVDEGQTLTYTLDDNYNLFAINSTGTIGLASGITVDRTELADVNYEYALGITATDNGSPPLSETASATVTVKDKSTSDAVPTAIINVILTFVSSLLVFALV